VELQRAGGWARLLEWICAGNGQLRERLDGAEPLWERPLAVGWIPYGYVARECDGMWRVGDQAAVIPSFTGDGMAIALHSGAQAAEMHLAGARAEVYLQRLARQLRRGMMLASAVAGVMVNPERQWLMPKLMPMLPFAMRWIAAGTRIPRCALSLLSP
jgi:menaquinone-9 beta-reductase